MKYLLDTNVYLALLTSRSRSDPLTRTVATWAPDLHLSSVVLLELLQGARGDLGRAAIWRAVRALERARRVVAPSHDDFRTAGSVQGRIWEERPDLRTKSLQNDLLLACSARRIGAVVVTYNAADFIVIASKVVHAWATPEQLMARG